MNTDNTSCRQLNRVKAATGVTVGLAAALMLGTALFAPTYVHAGPCTAYDPNTGACVAPATPWIGPEPAAGGAGPTPPSHSSLQKSYPR